MKGERSSLFQRKNGFHDFTLVPHHTKNPDSTLQFPRLMLLICILRQVDEMFSKKLAVVTKSHITLLRNHNRSRNFVVNLRRLL